MEGTIVQVKGGASGNTTKTKGAKLIALAIASGLFGVPCCYLILILQPLWRLLAKSLTMLKGQFVRKFRRFREWFVAFRTPRPIEPCGEDGIICRADALCAICRLDRKRLAKKSDQLTQVGLK